MSLGLGSLLEQILVSSLDGIVCWDLRSQTIFACNQAALQLLGFTRAELIGQTLKCLFPPQIEDQYPEILEQILQRNPYILETSGHGRDGRLICIEVAFSSLVDDSDEVIGVLVIARDIDEHKKIQLELEQKLSTGYGLFAPIVQKLREILHTITLGEAAATKALAKAQPDVEKARDSLGKVKTHIERMDYQIGNVLELVGILSGSLNFELIPTNLTTVVRSVVERLKAQAESRKIFLQSTLDEAIALVSGNHDRLQQALTRIVFVAMELAAPTGVITLSLKQIEGQVVVDIEISQLNIETDSGASPIDSSHLFSKKGLVIEITIIQGLIRYHQGILEIGSDSKGTVFSIKFPALHDGVVVPLAIEDSA